MIEILYPLAMGACIGVFGQLTRAVAGIYKARRAGDIFTFDTTLFLLGLFLGAVAGAACAWHIGFGRVEVATIFLAGYAGVDFIEAGFKK